MEDNIDVNAEQVNFEDVVDLEVYEMLKESLGEEKAKEAFHEFFVRVKENIDIALQSLDEKNYQEFGDQCHKIKSNIAYLGGAELQDMCQQYEQYAKNQEHDKIQEQEMSFRQCCEKTVSFLNKIF